MSSASTAPALSPLSLRLAHAFCTTIAVVSVFSTGFRTLVSAPGDGPEILPYAAFTLFFAHLAWRLGTRAHDNPHRRNRALVAFALFAGYLCTVCALLHLR